MPKNTPIFVTRPFLPPLEELQPLLAEIWQSRELTNGGAFHRQLEQALCQHLGVGELSLCANGTTALLLALQALGVRGEVITTPYSFVATAHALLWSGMRPVFADIDPDTLNLAPARIEELITPETTAILPVHVYGHPCDVDGIQAVADRHGLKVIYDAAHAFGVRYRGESLLRHGDLSILSFHATKVFNTFEGGAITCPDAAIKRHIDHLKNFGFEDEATVVAPGVNGKLNEFQAAIGLLQLRHFDTVVAERKRVDQRYREALDDVAGIRLHRLPDATDYNYSYFPVFVDDAYPLTRDALYQVLRDSDVFARRYFYPLISNLPMYEGLSSSSSSLLPVANSIADSVLCLPIYPEMSDESVDRVVDVIRNPQC